MAFDAADTASDALVLTGAEARGFIKIMAYGGELRMRLAGVRAALAVYRKAQMKARNGWLSAGSLRPEAARAWVRQRIAAVHACEAESGLTARCLREAM